MSGPQYGAIDMGEVVRRLNEQPAKDWGPGILTEKAQPNDPWQHRSEKMRCVSCMWFAPKAGNIGRCRRHAPTLNGYPVVYKSDWCGDHKLNEAT